MVVTVAAVLSRRAGAVDDGSPLVGASVVLASLTVGVVLMYVPRSRRYFAQRRR